MSDEPDDDDPQLTSLRAVWLSMPDEEPPQSGLAELMAAARIKADEMAKPSLWERIVALLRRPPVLALATVLVLIGGAVFIGQRRAAMEAEGPVGAVDQHLREANRGSAATATTTEYAPRAEPVAPSQAAAPAPEMVAPSGGVDQLDNNTDPAATPPRVDRRTGATRPADTTRARGATARDDDAKHEAPAAGTQLELGADGRGGDLSSDRFAAPPPEAQHAQGEKVQAPKADAKTTTQTTATTKATTKNEDAPSETVVGGAAPQDAPASTTSGTTSTSSGTRVSQYIAQAKSAAKRGDCGAAKTMMKRAAGEDAAAYRSALAGDAALRKCVGVPAAQ